MGKMSRRREARQAEAVSRDEARADRSPREQLSLLDSRLGESMGAQRERLRLLREIEESEKKRSTKKPDSERSTRERGERRKAKDRRKDERGRKG